MGKSVIKKRIFLYISSILLVSILLCIYSICILNRPYENIDTNLRLLLNSAVSKATNNDFTEIKNYTYVIYDLEGNVLNSNNNEYSKGNTINLISLSGNNISYNKKILKYRSPYLKDNKQIGTIEILINTDSVESTRFIYYVPIILLLLFIIFILYKLVLMIKKDILLPINEIHTVTKKLLKGDLSQRLYYDYDGEIGTLCHDFEALRIDLYYSFENEKKLKEKERLLLACISHDLKTPISTISGYVEGIHEGIVEDKKQIKEYTSIILNKIKMLTCLINDILEHSKSQLNEFSIVLEECYSKSFFESILNESKRDALKQGVNFTFSNIPDALINIDKRRISQVMQNLISNAIKFSKNNGEINVFFIIEDKNLLVSVKDNGVGIDATDQALIFNDFFRGEKARTLNVQGSGLGLSISKYIIEKHTGFIECDSILDYGTTITFSLPII